MNIGVHVSLSLLVSSVCMPNSGIVHPTAKRVVGERLAELAKAEIYGEPGAVSPRAVGRTVSGDTLTVRLSAPVLTRDGQAPRLLEIAEADGSFVPACAAVTGREIRLWAKGVTHPVHARYAWTDYSDAVNLFGENGLPLEPFRL